MAGRAFNTSYGGIIPGDAMDKVVNALRNGEDWQQVSVRYVRQYIPLHDEDLEELNEVLRAAELIIEVMP